MGKNIDDGSTERYLVGNQVRGWLVCWLIGRLVGFNVCWLVGLFVGCLVGWFVVGKIICMLAVLMVVGLLVG